MSQRKGQAINMFLGLKAASLAFKLAAYPPTHSASKDLGLHKQDLSKYRRKAGEDMHFDGEHGITH